MKKPEYVEFQDDSADELPQAWLGLIGLATSACPDFPLSDKTVANIKDGLMSRIRTSNLTPTVRDHQIILKDAEWQIVSPKLQVKVLRNDGITMSWLLKMSAGTTLSAHSHDDLDEECLVMQGSIRLDGKTLFEGDYTVAVKGTTHQDVYSETGCILFLKSPASHQKDLMALC